MTPSFPTRRFASLDAFEYHGMQRGGSASRGRMSVDTATVKRIASLARIAITDAEAERLAPELGNILGWIEQLGEVDTAAVEPMTAVIPNHLRLRDDVITDGEHGRTSGRERVGQ